MQHIFNGHCFSPYLLFERLANLALKAKSTPTALNFILQYPIPKQQAKEIPSSHYLMLNLHIPAIREDTQLD